MLARRSTLAVLLPLFVGCGAAPPAAPMASSSAAPIAKEPPIDLSPVPAPPGLVVVGRVSKPEAIVSTVAGWTHLPLPTGPELVRTIAEESVSDVVDLSQPIDAAVILSGARHGVEPAAAFAIVVKNFDAAKAKLGESHKLTAGANGQFQIDDFGFGKKKKGRSEDDDDDTSCVLAPSPVGGRIVCGDDAGLEGLVPYLSRSLPKEKWSSDLHVEVRPEALRGPLADLKMTITGIMNAFGNKGAATRALFEATFAEVADIVTDTQVLTFDSKITDGGVFFDERIAFQSKRSLFSQASASAKTGPAPAAFWHLPGDTDTALYGHGTDPQLFDHFRQLIGDSLLESTEAEGMPEAERKALKELVVDRAFPLFTSGPGVYGKGYDAAAVDKALAAVNASGATDRAAVKQQLLEEVIGWHLFEVSEPIAKVGPLFKDIAALYNRPALTKWIATKAKRAARVKQVAPPAGVKLPKDAVALDVTIPDKPPEPPPGGKAAPRKPLKPTVIHLLAVPDGAGTWIGVGLDAKLLAQKAAASLASAPETSTLGKAPGIETLRDGKLSGGGFFTMRGIVVLAALADDGVRSPYNLLATLPNKGATPLVFTARREAPSGAASAGASAGWFSVTRPAIEDFIRLATSGH